MPRLEGILCPAVTFYGPDGSVDLEAFATHLRNLVGRGLHGVAPIGTMGEFPLLRTEERKALAEAAVEAVGGKALVLVGTGSARTEEAVELTRHADDIGADGVLVVTPFYLRPNREGLRRHYEAIRRATDRPVLAYSVPSFARYRLEADLIADLAADGVLQGLKDSEGDLARDLRILERMPKDFALFTGADPIALPVLLHGGAGGILGTSNLFPATLADLYRLVRSGEIAKAEEIQAGVARLSEAIQTGPFPAATKYMVERVWGLRSALRLPVTPLSPEERARVDGILEPFLRTWR